MSGHDRPPRPFSTGQNVAIVAVTLVGAAVIVLGRDSGRSGLAVAGLVALLALLGVVLVAALGRGFTVPGVPRRGSGQAVRPLLLAGFLLVAGGLVWQAVRGLS